MRSFLLHLCGGSLQFCIGVRHVLRVFVPFRKIPLAGLYTAFRVRSRLGSRPSKKGRNRTEQDPKSIAAKKN